MSRFPSWSQSTSVVPIYLPSHSSGLIDPQAIRTTDFGRVRCSCEPWVKRLFNALAHPDEVAFLQQLEQDKKTGAYNTSLMLIYADWLEERGRGIEAQDLRQKAMTGKTWDSD